jgi:hypothetical protein
VFLVAFGVVVEDSSARLAVLVANLDPEVRAAIDDVDRTLIVLTLEQSPWNRLRSASRMAQTLGRFRDAIAP